MGGEADRLPCLPSAQSTKGREPSPLPLTLPLNLSLAPNQLSPMSGGKVSTMSAGMPERRPCLYSPILSGFECRFMFHDFRRTTLADRFFQLDDRGAVRAEHRKLRRRKLAHVGVFRIGRRLLENRERPVV